MGVAFTHSENVQRQLTATTATVGAVKVEVLARRLREIHPGVELDVRAEVYSAETAPSFDLAAYGYVVDAIDSLSEKAALIRHALSLPSVTLFSSMGAALKMDPFQIRASPFRKVVGDGLARALRQKFKKTGGLPTRSFTCVWSPEHRENLGPDRPDAATPSADRWSARRARVNGTVAHPRDVRLCPRRPRRRRRRTPSPAPSGTFPGVPLTGMASAR